MNEDNRPIMVTIRCITYNHERYIRQCLDGFMMQKTTFRYEIVIHDDASTDGTTSIVREFAERYPDIIIPIIEKENQYNNWDYIVEVINASTHGKYVAMCEGDDYWIDPNKLQKQVDYLEAHPECTMTCCRAFLFSQKDGKNIGEQYCQRHSGVLNPVDIINRTGLYIPTCSIVYRRNIMKDYPNYCMKCAVGDYPLQIYCAMKGEVYYFDNLMCAYRINIPSSWMGKQKWGSVTDERLAVIRSQIEMFRGFACDYKKYSKIFRDKIANHINRNVPGWWLPRDDVRKFIMCFEKDIKEYGFLWRVDLALRKSRIPLERFFYNRVFMRKYMQLRIIY